MQEAVVSRDLVQSVVRGVRVIEAFDGEHASMTLDQVVERCGVSRSATRRLLLTLEHAGLVSVSPDRHLFSLASGILDLGYVLQSQTPLAEVVAPHSRKLSERTGCSVGLAYLDGTEIVYVSRVSAPQYMEFGLRSGSRMPAHMLAIGRAQLAWRPDEELERYAASAVFRGNPVDGLVDGASFQREMQEIRIRGWAYIEGASDDGLSAIAAPVRDLSGRVVAGVNVAGQDGLTPFESLVSELLETVDEIAKDLHPRHRH